MPPRRTLLLILCVSRHFQPLDDLQLEVGEDIRGPSPVARLAVVRLEPEVPRGRAARRGQGDLRAQAGRGRRALGARGQTLGQEPRGRVARTRRVAVPVRFGSADGTPRVRFCACLRQEKPHLGPVPVAPSRRNPTPSSAPSLDVPTWIHACTFFRGLSARAATSTGPKPPLSRDPRRVGRGRDPGPPPPPMNEGIR